MTEQAMWRADPIRPGWRVCAICGHEGLDVLPSLAWLTVPGPDGPVQMVTRCRSARDCRLRCVENGDEWPIDDRDHGR